MGSKRSRVGSVTLTTRDRIWLGAFCLLGVIFVALVVYAGALAVDALLHEDLWHA